MPFTHNNCDFLAERQKFRLKMAHTKYSSRSSKYRFTELTSYNIFKKRFKRIGRVSQICPALFLQKLHHEARRIGSRKVEPGGKNQQPGVSRDPIDIDLEWWPFVR